MEANVSLDRAEADCLLALCVDLGKGLGSDVTDPGGAGDEVALPPVMQALGQVDVLIPEEEALVEAANPVPELAANDETSAGRLADLAHLARGWTRLRALAERADEDPHQHRRGSRQRC